MAVQNKFLPARQLEIKVEELKGAWRRSNHVGRANIIAEAGTSPAPTAEPAPHRRIQGSGCIIGAVLEPKATVATTAGSLVTTLRVSRGRSCGPSPLSARD